MERITRRDWSKYGFYDKETPILGARREYELYQRLGRYEDAEEQGLLLHLPCKVGDTVWQIMITGMKEKKILYSIYEATVIKWTVDIYNNLLISVITNDETKRQSQLDVAAIGISIFHTREEAEAKLKEMENENEIN